MICPAMQPESTVELSCVLHGLSASQKAVFLAAMSLLVGHK